MANVPEDLLHDIVSRLPIKSICRFKCVSKGWNTLFQSNRFITKHMQSAVDSDERHLILKYGHKLYRTHSIKSQSNEAVPLDYPCESSKDGVQLWGSSNGLLCISSYKDPDVLYIWNPSTRQYKKLLAAPPIEGVPESIIENFQGNFVGDISYGFGYDSNADDYKLVRVVGFPVGFPDQYGSEIRIYTLRTNSWTRSTFTSVRLSYLRKPGVLSSEAIHWVGTPQETQGDGRIFAYDFHKDTFQQVFGPASFSSALNISVCGLDGSLCLLGDSPHVSIEVWVMEIYGESKSWKKIVTISQPDVIQSFYHVRPIKRFDNGKILLEKDESSLVLYDPRSHKATDLKVDGLSEWQEAEIFVPSLVMINSNTYVVPSQPKKKQSGKGDLLFYGMFSAARSKK